MASTHDGSGKTYGGTGPHMGKSILQSGGIAYVVRLSWDAASTTPTSAAGGGVSTAPTLCNVRLRRWIEPQFNSTVVLIPGWDAANDADKDGYVSDAEFATLKNPLATARFRYESRAVPVGRMWSATSSWCRVNPYSVRLAQWLGGYLNNTWTAAGLSGAYNDDLLKLVGPEEYVVVRGGMLSEIDFRANSSELVVPFQKAFAAMLEAIRLVVRRWIAANIR